MKSNVTCFECGAIASDEHHVVPKSMGGSKVIPLCNLCHGKVHGTQRLNIRLMTKEALRHKSLKGEKTGGTLPFGYSLVDGFKLKALPGELETVKYMHKLRKKGFTLRGIIAELENQGIRTKTGKKRWNPKVVKGILERQIDQVCNSLELTDSEKDEALQDVTGALFDAESAA